MTSPKGRKNAALAQYAAAENGSPNARMRAIAAIAVQRGFNQENLAEAYNARFEARIGSEGVQRHFLANNPQQRTIKRYAELVGADAHYLDLTTASHEAIMNEWMHTRALALNYVPMKDLEAVNAVFGREPEKCRLALLAAASAWQVRRRELGPEPDHAAMRRYIHSPDFRQDFFERDKRETMLFRLGENQIKEREQEEILTRWHAIVASLRDEIEVKPQPPEFADTLLKIFRLLHPLLTDEQTEIAMGLVLSYIVRKDLPIEEMIEALGWDEHAADVQSRMEELFRAVSVREHLSERLPSAINSPSKESL